MSAINPQTTRQLCKSFYFFARAFWKFLEPDEALTEEPYVKAICDHLQAIHEQRVQNLLLNMPPGMGKSKLTVLFVAWVWSLAPSKKFLIVSNNKDLAMRNNNNFRTVISSELYRLLFPHIQLVGDGVEEVANNRTGYTVVLSASTRNVGYRCNYVISDDMNTFTESKERRDEIKRDWNKVFASRLNNIEQDHKIVIGHRVGTNDLSSLILENERNEWCVLSLPLEYKGESEPNKLGWKDHRTNIGEILTKRYTPESVARIKRNNTKADYESLYQQNPKPTEGSILKPINFYEALTDGFRLGSEIAPRSELQVFATTDLAVSLKDWADNTVFQVWGSWHHHMILLFQYRGKINGSNRLKLFHDLYIQWECEFIGVENSGQQGEIIQNLKELEKPRLSIKEFIPRKYGDKLARANRAILRCEQKTLWLPFDNDELLDEVNAFDGTEREKDDCVDALTMATILADRYCRYRPSPPPLTEEEQKAKADEWEKKEFARLMMQGT